MYNYLLLISSSMVLFFTIGCSYPKQVQKPMFKHEWVEISSKKRELFGVNDNGSLSRGKKLFMQHCKSCHGESGKGDGKWAKSFDIKPANLQKLSGTKPNHYLSLQIQDGSGDMPDWKNLLDSQQIWDLTNYIQSLKD